jgi:TRAP-type transport system periplasmic protein
MKRMRFLALAAIALLGAPQALRAQQFNVKIGLATLDDAQNVWADQYAAMLEKDSGGRIKASVYPDSQLGSIPRMIEQTQFGAIQAWIGPPEFLYGVDRRFELLTAPGLFKSLAQANTVLQDPQFATQFLAMGEKKGLTGIGLFLTGPMAFQLRENVRDLSGFAGLKVRVLASPMQTEQMRVLKGVPVPMSLGEVMPALQQGALDGVMTSPPVATPLKLMSVAKYLIDTEQCMVTSMALVSRKWLQSLPPDLQKIVIEDGRKESVAIFSVTQQKLAASDADWTKGGGVIVPFDASQKAKMDELMAPIGQKVVDSEGEDAKAMYAALLAAIKRAE